MWGLGFKVQGLGLVGFWSQASVLEELWGLLDMRIVSLRAYSALEVDTHVHQFRVPS